MGGTRFAHVGETVRIPRQVHDEIAAQTIAALAGVGIDAHVIPHCHLKMDFGDVDLLCPESQTHQGLPEESDKAIGALFKRDEKIAGAIGAADFHRGPLRNPTLHMLLNRPEGLVQMDVCSVPDDKLDFVTAQLSWGDAGSLSAIIGRQMGLKIGMNGIQLVEEAPHGQIRAPIELPHGEMLEMLGLDPVRHANGFDRPEDVFAWVADGAYFDPRIWQIDRLTNKARHRAGRRPGYQAFLAWLKEKGLEARYDWGDVRGARIGEWNAVLRSRFPAAAALLDEQRDLKTASGLKAFFTGAFVTKVTGVADGRLEHLMNAIRKNVGEKRLEALADKGDEETLAELVLEISKTDYMPNKPD